MDTPRELPVRASGFGRARDGECQGESDESQVEVSITLNGEELRGTIEQLAAGEADTVKVPITTLPQPGTETSLDVIIKPVSGESVTDNNQASYTVVFGSSDSTSP